MVIAPLNLPDTPELEWEIIEGNPNYCLITDETYQKCNEILQNYSKDSIDNDIWNCMHSANTKMASVSFRKLDLNEQGIRAVKVYVIDSLSRGIVPQTCAHNVSRLRYLFDFLNETGISITRISTSVVHRFSSWLDMKYPNDTAEKKNNIEGVAAGFIIFLQKRGLLSQTPIEFPKRRKTISSPKRAPERAVIYQLDKYLFDFSNPVPSDIRCVYILHRILPSRSSEVRLIHLDGYRIEDGLLLLEVPTQKETAFHRPFYRTFPFYTTGTVFETALCQALNEQRAFAIKAQPSVQDLHKGYLMVSTVHPNRLLDTQDFNDALGDICEKLRLSDSEGNAVRVTSHMLRHVSIGNQMRYGVPLEELQYRSGHKSVDTTFGYGYLSEHDESKELAKLATAAHAELSMPNEVKETVSEYRTVLPKRFEKLRGGDAWRIGKDCICTQTDCRPQWEKCIMTCEKFEPDKKYLPMAKALCEELEALGAARSEHQERQFTIWKTFIAKAGGD